MAIKSTMNKIDIVQYHKMLEDDVKLEKISKAMSITVDTLKKFTPEIMDKIKKENIVSRKKLLDKHRPDAKSTDKKVT